jgi:DNA modification methylase
MLLHGDCLEHMRRMPEACIDLTVTSPPYDSLRAYNGYSFDFEGIARELYRIIKPGGVVVWVVGDATVKGSETGTSFRQALYFKDVCGFNLHDTMIYEKAGTGACGSNRAYWQGFEYMFVLSKGRPKTVNRIADKVNAWGGTHTAGRDRVGASGQRRQYRARMIPATSVRTNIWRYHGGKCAGFKADAPRHPAVFPETLARDHILSWSDPGNTVFDPFTGSGTTGKMAILHGRKFIGCEISAEYIEIVPYGGSRPAPCIRIDSYRERATGRAAVTYT